MDSHAAKASAARLSSFTAADVLAILHEQGWLSGDPTVEQVAWCRRAASLLSPHAADGPALADLLRLIFHYHAAELLAQVETHVVLSRYAARDVLGKLALLLLDGVPGERTAQVRCACFMRHFHVLAHPLTRTGAVEIVVGNPRRHPVIALCVSLAAARIQVRVDVLGVGRDGKEGS